MASALRSPVLWILIACVLVILGITLLFELQESDTDWRRRRWDGSDSALAETPVPAEGPASVRAAEEPEAARILDEFEGALKALDWLQVLLRNWRTSNDELMELIGRVESGLLVHERVGGLAETSQLAKTMGVDFHRDAEEALFKAFTLVKQVRRSHGNQRAPVNQRAVRAIGRVSPFLEQSTRARWSSRLIRELHRMGSVRYEVDAGLERAGFTALALMGELLALEWMTEEFIHNRPSARHVERLRAAHAAMLVYPYDKVDGKLRHHIVKQMVSTYHGTEVMAERDSGTRGDQAALAFWDRVGSGVLAVLRQFAGEEASYLDGEPFTRVNEFEAWFREHKDVKKAPWEGP